MMRGNGQHSETRLLRVGFMRLCIGVDCTRGLCAPCLDSLQMMTINPYRSPIIMCYFLNSLNPNLSKAIRIAGAHLSTVFYFNLNYSWILIGIISNSFQRQEWLYNLPNWKSVTAAYTIVKGWKIYFICRKKLWEKLKFVINSMELQQGKLKINNTRIKGTISLV